MKVIVCGGRQYCNWSRLQSTLDRIHKVTPITTLIEGGARGADRLAAVWARLNNIQWVRVDANWPAHGRSAGPRRNLEMLKLNPQLVIAFPGGQGTAHMIKAAHQQGVQVVYTT